jgi:hypothetical protein
MDLEKGRASLIERSNSLEEALMTREASRADGEGRIRSPIVSPRSRPSLSCIGTRPNGASRNSMTASRVSAPLAAPPWMKK